MTARMEEEEERAHATPPVLHTCLHSLSLSLPGEEAETMK